ncbi:MAG: flagellar protein FlaG, partial [Desulfovibrionaceae bacterium]
MNMQEIDITLGSGSYAGGVGFGVRPDTAGQDRKTATTQDSEAKSSRESKGGSTEKGETLKSLRSAQDLLAERGVDLDFNLVGDDEELQVEVRDPRSGKLIRKLPPDELIKLSESLDQMSGVMVDQPISSTGT